MENKVKNVLSGIGFYGTLAVCLLVVGVCGWVLLQDREDPLPQQAVTPQVPVSQPVEMPEVRLPAVETLAPAPPTALPCAPWPSVRCAARCWAPSPGTSAALWTMC